MKGFVSVFQILGRVLLRKYETTGRRTSSLDIDEYLCPQIKNPVYMGQRNQPHRRNIEPLRRNIEPHCGIIQPHCWLIQPEVLRVNENSVLESDNIESFILQETTMEAVINNHKHSCESVIDTSEYNPNSDRNSCSMSTYRYSVRNCYRSSKTRSFIHTQMHRRDRETSRICVEKVMRTLRKRKNRLKYKRNVRKSIPVSSTLYNLATDYKLYFVNYVLRKECFFSNYFRRQSSCVYGKCRNSQNNMTFKQGLTNRRHLKPRNPNVIHLNQDPEGGAIEKEKCCTMMHNVSDQNILLSGDVELNPGPRITCTTTGEEIISFNDPDFVFKYRLLRYNLRPLDVGGEGDCFFKAVSHQLYGVPSHHLQIRSQGIKSNCL